MIDNKTIRKVIMLNKCLKGGSPTYENREASGAVANIETNTVQPFVKCECTIDATESGTDELTLIRTGANLFHDSFEIGTIGESSPAGSTWELMKIRTVDNRADSVGLFEIPNEEGVVFSCNPDYQMFIAYFDENQLYLGSPNFRPWNTLITIQAGTCSYLSVTFRRVDNAPITDTDYQNVEIMANFGNTATTYEPYNAETYIVTLEETAYGGSVDVIAGSGRIIDEHGDLVYTLFEPVSISSLEGVNNVWCDTGNTKVTYKYKTGGGGSSTKKYLPIFYDLYGEEKYHDHS